MPAPVDDTYSAPSGATVRGGRFAPPVGITIHGQFERSNINDALSEVVTDSDEVELVRLKVRETTTTSTSWLCAYGKVSGMMGRRPRFELFDYPGVANWNSLARPLFSEDGGDTWTPFATVESRVAGNCKFRHDEPFTANEVLISEFLPITVTQMGARIDALASAHPTKVAPTALAATHTTGTVGFPAESFIVADLIPGINELGQAIPSTPLYAFQIDDQAYGAKPKVMAFTGGIHAGEDIGALIMLGLIDWLLGESAAAVRLRQRYKIIFYPLVNPIGRWDGHQRGVPGYGGDPNRMMDQTSPTLDMVKKLRGSIIADAQPAEVYFDFHSQAGYSEGRVWASYRDGADSEPWHADWKARLGAIGKTLGKYGSSSGFPTVSTLRYFGEDVLGARLTAVIEIDQVGPPIDVDDMRPHANTMGEAIDAVVQTWV